MSPPHIEDLKIHPPSPQLGEPVNISATITDNKGIHSVYLTLTPPTGTTQNFSITQNTTGTIYFCNQTYTLPGHYSASLYVTDTSNTSIRSPLVHFTINTSETTCHLPLFPGWNLITVPVGNEWTAETLGKNISTCTVVSRFNGSSQTFVSHVVGTSHDNFPILDGVGYFIYLTHDVSVNMTGLPILSVNVSIYVGWNMVGWYPGSSISAESLGTQINGCSVVSLFNGSSQTFISHVIGTPHDNFTIHQGMGLFIYATTHSWWTGHT
jgi:hypothetical protein